MGAVAEKKAGREWGAKARKRAEDEKGEQKPEKRLGEK